MYADIIVDISHEQLDKTFQYKIPSILEGKIDIGVMVNVPFGGGNRIITGYVINITDKPSFNPLKTKEIIGIVNNSMPAVERMIKLAAWIKHNYGSTMNQALKTVMPVKEKVREIQKKDILLNISKNEAQKYVDSIKNNARYISRCKLLESLIQYNKLDVNYVKNELNISMSVINTLKKSGYIKVNVTNSYRIPISGYNQENNNLLLNEEQQKLVETFKDDYDKGIRNTYLVHGVTGSGKTLCYIEMIDYVVSKGKQAILLIPEISLTFQTVKRLYARFGENVSILNSRMSKGERYDQFRRAMEGDISIMVGPRSALFTPFSNIGIIIIDEEHEGAYKSDVSPRYHARETAIYIASTMNASVVLGSATPSVESYYKAQIGQYKFFTLSKRAGGAKLPVVYTVDLREELKSGNRTIFSRKLYELMLDRLSNNQQIMLFLNKRGYAGFISCRACGHVFKCPHCDISLTYHKNNKLICHYCGYEEEAVKVCPKCGSQYVSGFRAGTQQIEEMVKKYFPNAKTLRMDYDTTSGKDGHKKILSAFANHEADILIGTQMIVKGHDFKDVTLVGILAADMSLYADDYKATEKTFQLLVQAAGRAGRAGSDAKGEVVIQTYTPDNYGIVAAGNQDYKAFYDEEIAYRMLLGYPPIENMLKVAISSKDTKKLDFASSDIKLWYEENIKTAPQFKKRQKCTGPVEAAIYKLNDIYTQVMYVKSNDYEILTNIKDLIENYIIDNSIYRNINIQFDFN